VLHSTRLRLGSQIVATRDFGPVVKGQLGIITHVVRTHRLFWRHLYICTFLGDIFAVALSHEIERFSHGIQIEILKNPLWFTNSSCWRKAYGAVPGWRVLRSQGPRLEWTESVVRENDELGKRRWTMDRRQR
jgi:hypothetical protein